MLAARRTSTFTESVIREMTRIAQMHEAVNLAQGFPDFPMPEPMKDAACAAIQGNLNQYAVTWGSANLRIGIAEKTTDVSFNLAEGRDSAFELRTDLDQLGRYDFGLRVDATRPEKRLQHILYKAFFGLTFDKNQYLAHV